MASYKTMFFKISKLLLQYNYQLLPYPHHVYFG